MPEEVGIWFAWHDGQEPGSPLLLERYPRVGHGGRMLDKGLDPAQGHRQSGQPDSVHEVLPRFQATSSRASIQRAILAALS
jgi:hypothetical protein